MAALLEILPIVDETTLMGDVTMVAVSNLLERPVVPHPAQDVSNFAM